MSEFHFGSISWVWINEFWLNFAHALLLTTSSLGLLTLFSIHFRQFIIELWPLNDVRISFLLSILRMNGFWPNFTYALILITSSLGLLSVYFRQLLQNCIPWMSSEFRFCSISWEWINRFWPNLAHALILTTSSLALLSVHFCQFVTELLPLNDVRISFLLIILRMNKWILTKFYICIDIDNI